MITTAVQRENFVYVYSGTQQLFCKSGELAGFTSASVSVKNGGFIYVFDDKGRQISCHAAY